MASFEPAVGYHTYYQIIEVRIIEAHVQIIKDAQSVLTFRYLKEMAMCILFPKQDSFLIRFKKATLYQKDVITCMHTRTDLNF